MRTLWAAMILASSSVPPVAADNGSSPVTYVLADWFPYGWQKNDEPQGLLVDIAKAVDKALSVRNNYAVAPVPRVLRSIKSGEYDFSIIYHGQKLNRQVDHVLDVGCIRTAVVSIRDRPVKKIDDMNGMRVAYSSSGYFADNFLPKLDLDGMAVANSDIMFRMALRGRLDAFVIDDAVLQGYRLELDPGRRQTVVQWQSFAQPFYLESLRLAVTSSFDNKHVALKKRMRGLLGDASFVSDLQEIYDIYGLPFGTACLHLVDH